MELYVYMLILKGLVTKQLNINFPAILVLQDKSAIIRKLGYRQRTNEPHSFFDKARCKAWPEDHLSPPWPPTPCVVPVLDIPILPTLSTRGLLRLPLRLKTTAEGPLSQMNLNLIMSLSLWQTTFIVTAHVCFHSTRFTTESCARISSWQWERCGNNNMLNL